MGRSPAPPHGCRDDSLSGCCAGHGLGTSSPALGEGAHTGSLRECSHCRHRRICWLLATFLLSKQFYCMQKAKPSVTDTGSPISDRSVLLSLTRSDVWTSNSILAVQAIPFRKRDGTVVRSPSLPLQSAWMNMLRSSTCGLSACTETGSALGH